MNVPKLRFKEFNDEWEEIKLKNIVNFSKGNILSKNDLDENGKFPCILYGQLYTKYKEVIREIFSRTNNDSSNIVKSKIGDVLIPSSGETPIDISTSSCLMLDNILVGGDINILSPKENCNGRFLSYMINNNKKIEIAKVAQGHSIVHLYNDNLKDIIIKMPSLKEQEQVANVLEILDKKIELQSKKIEALKLYKMCIKKIVFKDKRTWKSKKIYEVLDFEQPNKYLVYSEDYIDDKTMIPVLTANKGFILGYCNEDNYYNKGNSIIFDDFTMDMKYTNFLYKIKSSAIKILTPKNNNNLKFLYECLLSLNLSSEEHKRHYISIVQNMVIHVPNIDIQNKIAKILSIYDKKIELEKLKLEKLESLKKGLMQKIFV